MASTTEQTLMLLSLLIRLKANVPQRHRALHTVDTGILEKALTMEEVRRLGC